MIFWNFSRKYVKQKASPESENAQQTEAPEEVPEVPADLTKKCLNLRR